MILWPREEEIQLPKWESPFLTLWRHCMGFQCPFFSRECQVNICSIWELPLTSMSLILSQPWRKDYFELLLGLEFYVLKLYSPFFPTVTLLNCLLPLHVLMNTCQDQVREAELGLTKEVTASWRAVSFGFISCLYRREEVCCGLIKGKEEWEGPDCFQSLN